MAAVNEPAASKEIPTGGAFLFQEVGTSRFVTPETFTEEQRLFFRTALQFSREQVLPQAVRIEHKDNVLLRELLRHAGELGLLSVDIPEAYGGTGLDKTTSLLLAEAMSLNGSWSVTFGAHTGIGSLPIVWFGNAAQKAKYLPKLGTGEWVAAYALTEQGSGSDALGAKTKAVRSPDGKHWILNGSKLYITNAAFADVFIVFAKVDGDKFTGFIVEKDTPGLTVGPEEHKMGIRGSSTCPLYFEDARVPAENLLGEVGKGHKIAFNILNYGRLKLGAGVLGGMKLQLGNALRFVQERKQFGTPIVRFPLSREKLARMAALIYALESMTYRTTGLVDARLAARDKSAPGYEGHLLAAVEEYAIESSIMKVYGSEALGQVVDDAVQLHGGAGYIEEYPVERAYRDARINRIFEGTNEINRMLITGMLIKRAVKGDLPLFAMAGNVAEELSRGEKPRARTDDALAPQEVAAEVAKRLALHGLRVAAETFGPELEQHQEVLASLSDVVMDAFALDSLVTRTRQAASGGTLDPVRLALVRLFALDSIPRAYDRTRRALCATLQGDALDKELKRLATQDIFTPYNPAELRETVMAAIESAGGYPFTE
ncbi:acyl-CoA dehydrogenase family protein [Myxococcus sp. CA051A]|uniref:Acyl-CoA dehydrogenase n=1 Tax=Myxococcus llanfairpwllgwyngyllgogerychwyrndrobwllllantysiliogogogochensis TaxID=2590453 RepID=A0A540WNI0_9BACT|nr:MULTISPECIES: acyl-CoA dehydrogenase family protein [Myxococcus]NTX00763.1 acyl-CoA dehydrogenase family protein [Myxococcus sp. CA040A]NTX12533.1 acyl-CoA dehydrogenase family protein [Myxococcus sp. CA056]NTX33552.1 acyl-CoA dehydrogenase family protein [Myxococcus sp. CA033]NTX56936.1 acyl-CoA dehydrogenase family protein [Myxococcus sp. CA039A]NTX59341.1 acyl-CoA dehydrogenase family protein [Myxococcus sp. CA051A]